MDVTFFEHQSYYPKPEIQGEQLREYQFWDILQDTQSQVHQPEISQVIPLLSQQSEPLITKPESLKSINQMPQNYETKLPEIVSHQPETNNQKELNVYYRKRRKSFEQLEHITQIKVPPTSEICIGTDSYNNEFVNPIVDDSDFPIALRKGVQACTKHPIGNYVAYEKLLPPYGVFVSTRDDTQVPNSIREALKIPAWVKQWKMRSKH